MKNLIFIFILFTSNLVNAQTFNYYNEYLKDSLEIQLTKGKDNYQMFIHGVSLNGEDKGGFYIMNKVRHQAFLNSLTEIISIYDEWVRIAKENNVEPMRKSINTMKSHGFFRYANEWYFNYNNTVNFEFVVLSDKEYLLMVHTGKLKASSNMFITSEGYTLLFQNSQEIRDFVDLISLENIQKELNKPSAEDLFKN